MKMLTAGYGAGNGPNMVLLCSSRVVSPKMEDVLLSYSCYPPALPKIRQCLERSGRYDAWLQPGWVFSYHKEVRQDLADLGIEFHITSVPPIYEAERVRSKLELSVMA